MWQVEPQKMYWREEGEPKVSKNFYLHTVWTCCDARKNDMWKQQELTYLGGWVSTGGKYEAVATGRT